MTCKQRFGGCECCGLGGYCVLLLVFIVLVISSFGRYYVLQIIADHLFLNLDIPPIACVPPVISRYYSFDPHFWVASGPSDSLSLDPTTPSV